MRMRMSLKTLAIATSTVACAALLSFGWAPQGGVSLSVDKAPGYTRGGGGPYLHRPDSYPSAGRRRAAYRCRSTRPRRIHGLWSGPISTDRTLSLRVFLGMP